MIGVPRIVVLPAALEDRVVARAVFGVFPALDSAAVLMGVERVVCSISVSPVQALLVRSVELTIARLPNPEAIRINDLTRKIEQAVLIRHMPESTDGVHRLHHFRVAPDLHLRACPVQTKCLHIMLGEAVGFRVSFGVLSQFVLPGDRLRFGHDVADDQATAVVHYGDETIRKGSAVSFNDGEIDLGNRAGAKFSDAFGFSFEDLLEAGVGVDNSVAILGVYDLLFEN